MPDIPLDLRAIDYATDEGLVVRAWRAFLDVRFIGQNGSSIPFECFVDPGAPFCVLPYSLWRGRRVSWTRLGTRLSRIGNPVPGVLTWQGAPCDLGQTSLYLVDLEAGHRTGPYQVTAKFVRQRLAPAMERAAILGMNFLADNSLRLELEGIMGDLSGDLSVPTSYRFPGSTDSP
jgi:hypothetical protein